MTEPTLEQWSPLGLDGAPVPPRRYPDFHDHLARLEAAGLLVRVPQEVNKDRHLHALVRWQYRGGIKDADRKAFLFERPIDSKGRRFDIPVAVGALAGNRQIYAMSVGSDIRGMAARWTAARARPIAPVEIPSAAAPVHEIVCAGDDLRVPGQGLDGLPVPISTPGWENAPYLTVSNFITKDPDSGIHNVGNYRAMVKTPTRLGFNTSIEMGQGGYLHWVKYRERGEPMPVAICIGGPPVICCVAVQKLAYDEDEYAVAGGLVAAPIRLVRARTVPLLVPADAEIIVEGYASTEWLEPEGPFGESHGHMNPKEFNQFVDVTAITRRKQAVLASIVSQVMPSESSVIARIPREAAFLDHMQRIGLRGIVSVTLHDRLTGLQKVAVLQFRPTSRAEIWRGLHAALTVMRAYGKFVIAVDEDIDPENADALLWAMGYRCNPQHDTHVVPVRDSGHAPRHDQRDATPAVDSALLIDATRKGPLPPVSLPKEQYMVEARAIWEGLGLPELRPEAPWHGYSLGDWHPELDAEAELAVASEYWQTGEKNAGQRRSTREIPPNTSFYDQVPEKT